MFEKKLNAIMRLSWAILLLAIGMGVLFFKEMSMQSFMGLVFLALSFIVVRQQD